MLTSDYYSILGLSETASQDEIKQAYRMYSKKYHPDINSDPNATAMFRLIKDAYSALTSTPPPKQDIPDESPPATYKQDCDIPDEQSHAASSSCFKIIKFICKLPAIILFPLLWALKLPVLIIGSIGYILSGLFGLGAIFSIVDVFFKITSESPDWSAVIFCGVVSGLLFLITILSSFLLNFLDSWREALLDFILSPL